MRPGGGPPLGRPLAPPYQQQQQQPLGAPGVRPGFAPGQHPATASHPGPYANGPGAVVTPPGVPPAAGAPQALAGQMQQLKLGPGPPGQLGPRPVPAGPPGTMPPGARPLGPPAAAGPGVLQRPPAAGPVPQQPAPAANGYSYGAPPAGSNFPQRPPAMGPGMQPPSQPAAAGAVPGAVPRPPAAAAGLRPPGPPGTMPRPGMPPAAGGLAPRPAGSMGAGMPGPVPGPGLAPMGQHPPGALGAGGLAPGRPPAMGAAAPAPGFSTPQKAGIQQRPQGTPPPVAVQLSSPSPTKRGLAQPGQPQQAHVMQGLRPPMPPPGAPHMPPQQPGLMPGMQHPQPPMPGMMPPQQQQPPGMMPPQPAMPGMQQPRPPMPGGMMQPGMQQQQPAQSASSKIDPAQIPRPMPYSIPTQVFETRREDTHAIPPAADAPIVVRDRGSCGPRFLRSSLNMVPQTADVLKGTALPLVAIINPLALQDPADDPVPVVECGPAGPVRCQACKAYVNPYMRWVDGGRNMLCNFCGATTEVPADYQCHTGPDGERRDKYERPELCKGSVEMTVTPEYMVRPPMRPTHFFLIDVSQPAVSSGATAAICSSVAKILDDLPGGDRTQVCVATFDATIHFYSMRPGQAQPHMLVVPDVTDVYCPLAGNVVVNLQESRQLLESLLESIPKMFAGTQVMETCGGAALRSAVEALKGGEGGRLHAFLCSLPRRGALHLRLRDVGRPPTDRDSMDNMLPESKEYLALATDAAEHQISIDLFVMAQLYADVATLGVLCAHTSGSLYHWAPWNPALDADEFFNDLRWAVMRPQGLEAVGRLRVSKGLAVDKYYGAFHRRVETDLNFPTLSCDHSVAAKLVHEDKLAERGEAYLQFALLYTTVEGQRRVRVHTLALPITQSLGTAFRGADLDAYMCYVARKVSSQVPGHALGACKEAINKAATDALLAYRTHCAAASSSGQLILPEALKLLPLYTLSLSKAPVFRTDTRPDARAAAMWRMLSLPVHKAVPLVYGRMLPLHNLLERPENAMLVPDKLWLSAEKLDPEGVFLLENGFEAFVYVGKAVAPQTCMALFGVPSLDAADPQRPLTLPALDTPLSRKVQELLNELRRQRAAYLRLRVVRRGDPLEGVFYSALVEDRSPASGMSYVEYLCFLHRQIQNKLS